MPFEGPPPLGVALSDFFLVLGRDTEAVRMTASSTSKQVRGLSSTLMETLEGLVSMGHMEGGRGGKCAPGVPSGPWKEALRTPGCPGLLAPTVGHDTSQSTMNLVLHLLKSPCSLSPWRRKREGDEPLMGMQRVRGWVWSLPLSTPPGAHQSCLPASSGFFAG